MQKRLIKFVVFFLALTGIRVGLGGCPRETLVEDLIWYLERLQNWYVTDDSMVRWSTVRRMMYETLQIGLLMDENAAWSRSGQIVPKQLVSQMQLCVNSVLDYPVPARILNADMRMRAQTIEYLASDPMQYREFWSSIATVLEVMGMEFSLEKEFPPGMLPTLVSEELFDQTLTLILKKNATINHDAKGHTRVMQMTPRSYREAVGGNGSPPGLDEPFSIWEKLYNPLGVYFSKDLLASSTQFYISLLVNNSMIGDFFTISQELKKREVKLSVTPPPLP